MLPTMNEQEQNIADTILTIIEHSILKKGKHMTHTEAIGAYMDFLRCVQIRDSMKRFHDLTATEKGAVKEPWH